MARKAAIIGDGGWGTALALVLNENGYRVSVWGPFADYVDQIRNGRENVEYLPGVPIPAEIDWTAEEAAAADDAELCVLAVPSRYFRSVATRFTGRLPDRCTVVSVAKGLDAESGGRMTAVAEELLRVRSVCALSGPSHAEEVARKVPTAVTAAARDPDRAVFVQDALSNDYLRVYTSPDVIGVELGGALKNVIALAVGVSDGIGFGDNTRAAIITRGLVEITRLGSALGADPATFSGLSGMGDLIVTCTSRHSRNRAVGERIGRGERAEDILAGMKQVAEGVTNCAAACSLADTVHVEIPIMREVYAILHQGKNPRDAVTALLSRPVKPE